MLKEQVKKYENIRQLLLNPDKAIVSNKQERMESFPFLSLNFTIERNLAIKINNIIGALASEDPSHDYIPVSELHCTVKSFGLIGKQFNEQIIPQIIERVERIVKNFPSFKIEIRGLNAFSAAAFIQVFSKDNQLFKLHNLLNTAIPYSEYPQLEGKGYTPHITIAYFCHKPNRLFSALNKYKNTPIGEMEVNRLNLIRGQPQQLIKRELIKSFQLK